MTFIEDDLVRVIASSQSGRVVGFCPPNVLVHLIRTSENVFYPKTAIRHEDCAPGADPVRRKTTLDEAEAYRQTAFALCEGHKHKCHGANCGVSLDSIRQMAEAAGVVFTRAEATSFA